MIFEGFVGFPEEFGFGFGQVKLSYGIEMRLYNIT